MKYTPIELQFDKLYYAKRLEKANIRNIIIKIDGSLTSWAESKIKKETVSFFPF